MAITIEMLNDAELRYVCTIIGESFSDLDEDKKYMISLYYRNAEKALVDRRYPFGCTDEEAQEAITRYSVNIDKAFIDVWNRIGADNEIMHTESGISRTYVDFESYFSTVVPKAKVL